jgi:hypothetical protein
MVASFFHYDYQRRDHAQSHAFILTVILFVVECVEKKSKIVLYSNDSGIKASKKERYCRVVGDRHRNSNSEKRRMKKKRRRLKEKRDSCCV